MCLLGQHGRQVCPLAPQLTVPNLLYSSRCTLLRSLQAGVRGGTETFVHQSHSFSVSDVLLSGKGTVFLVLAPSICVFADLRILFATEA
mmetsp:Transcript_7169/g.21872  ORF Transcript_7169/g.21872 Transcript_7169/m.21872 type:complete len:89 (+) Transcript_7169:3361-3627(+)